MGIDKDDVRRIQQSVQGFERASKNNPYKTGSAPVTTDNGFWAKVTSVAYSGSIGKYAWNEVQFKDDSDPGTQNPSPGWRSGSTSTNFAIELSGYKFVPDNSLVFMRSTMAYPYFVFEWGGDKIVKGKADEDIPQGDTGDVRVYKDGSDTGETIEVTNLCWNLYNDQDCMVGLIGSTWYVISFGGKQIRKYQAQLNGTLSTGSSATIDNVVALDGGSLPDDEPDTAANPLKWAGADNDVCFIEEKWTAGVVSYVLTSVAWDSVSTTVNVGDGGSALYYTNQNRLGKNTGSTSGTNFVSVDDECPEE